MSEVSDLRRLAEALRASEARLKAVIECLPFDFWMLGTDGTYVMQNSSSRALWGEIVGKRPEDVQTDRESLALWQDNNRRAIAGENVRGEVVFRAKDRTRHFYNVIAPIRAEGEMFGILGINLDITERKEAEEELARKNEALREANEKLAALNRSKDRTTAMISHELRNPLVTGLGYVEMLLEQKFGRITELARAKMLVARRNLQRLAMLVELVLKYQRILETSHEGLSTMAPFDLREVAQEIIESRSSAWGEREVRLDVEASLPQVIGDRELIRMALTNLLNNAVVHAGSGARVRIVCRAVAGKVEVAVEDTGVGVPAALLESVFEPFVRGPTEHDGFGLGLPIVRAVLAAHRSAVTLNSEEGRGTSVSFLLSAEPLERTGGASP